MNRNLIGCVVLSHLLLLNVGYSQVLTPDIAYTANLHERHVLDIYSPTAASDDSLPVMFWIHGGGWQLGDKSDVGLKPKVLTEQGSIFVSTNYRLLPEVETARLARF